MDEGSHSIRRVNTVLIFNPFLPGAPLNPLIVTAAKKLLFYKLLVHLMKDSILETKA